MAKLKADDFRGYTVNAYQNKGRLLQPFMVLSDVDVKSTHFHYWKLNRLLLNISDGKRAELSIVDVIWLEILKSLKNLGCSLKALKAVHKVLFEDSYYKNHAEQNLIRNLQAITNQEKERELTEEEQTIKASLFDTMHDPLLRAYLRWSISHLYTLVLECIEEGSLIYIRLHENGQVVIEGHSAELAIDALELKSKTNNYIQICLTDIVNRFFSDNLIQQKFEEKDLLSSDERLVLKEMRKRNLKTLTIHFDDKENKIIKIESDSTGFISGEKAGQVMKILGLKNYTGIELHTRDGKNLSFVHTEKKFFK